MQIFKLSSSHWILWSIFRMDVIGSSAIALNASNGHGWSSREVNVEVRSEAEVVRVRAEPSVGQVSSEFALVARYFALIWNFIINPVSQRRWRHSRLRCNLHISFVPPNRSASLNLVDWSIELSHASSLIITG